MIDQSLSNLSVCTAEDTVHYFLLMVRNGAQVIVTQMVSTHDAVRGVLHFPNLIKLNDIMNDFRYELEVYAMVCTFC